MPSKKPLRIRRFTVLAICGLTLAILVAYADYAAREYHSRTKPRPYLGIVIPPGLPPPHTLVSLGQRSPWKLLAPSVPEWFVGFENGEAEDHLAIYTGYGYPFRTLSTLRRMRAVDHMGPDIYSYDLVDATPYPRWYHAGLKLSASSYSHPLPFMVLPLGLLTNSMIYAIALGVATAAWRGIKARKRRSRGCCVTCGYEVKTLHRCPECGQNPSSPRMVP